ncbi:hypothetical protein [Mongoliitalea daihaiensis]|uniref:hypothetical protein n=1 Tax=Mongoliitalea daihaiensis TaxID=2782006 RepID=UPI001F3A6784|nr:hypothetical protein [Mongoliitalea daihaiensis]UJP63747.1 hypothetical protein IPZ59_13015 [Mongoliitalea daihaiensis]
MKGNKLSLLFFLIFMGFVPLSCDLFCLDDCSCGRVPKVRDFRIEKFDAQVINLVQDFDHTQAYAYKEVAIVIAIEETAMIGYLNAKTNFGLIPSALACSPISPVSIDYVKDLKVLANTVVDWNGKAYQAGTDLSFLFGVIMGGGNLLPLDEFLNLRFDFFENDQIRLQLLTAPHYSVEFDLGLVLTLSDDRRFSFEGLRLKVF